MYPTIGHDLAKAEMTGLRQQAQRQARARAVRRARRTAARLNVPDAQHQALFASTLQRSDGPGAEVVAEAIAASMRHFGAEGCTCLMAQEFGDHPEAAAARMRWVRSLLT
jgi:hypothetical protein